MPATKTVAACLVIVVTGCAAETTSEPAVVPIGNTASPATEPPPAGVASIMPLPSMVSTTTLPPLPATTTTTAAPTMTTTTTTTTAATTTTTTVPTTTPYVVPVAAVDLAGWGDTHSTYPATDIFVGCGAELLSPVNGTVLEVRRTDSWDPVVDNPATRGGRSVSILGDDGVRYYLAHFDEITEPLETGDRVGAGQLLGTMGDTGRSSACHLHFAISPPCPGKEWSVRRGVVWPYPYLDAWRQGDQTSPVDEVAAWAASHPDACSEAMADPNAADA